MINLTEDQLKQLQERIGTFKAKRPPIDFVSQLLANAQPNTNYVRTEAGPAEQVGLRTNVNAPEQPASPLLDKFKQAKDLMAKRQLAYRVGNSVIPETLAEKAAVENPTASSSKGVIPPKDKLPGNKQEQRDYLTGEGDKNYSTELIHKWINEQRMRKDKEPDKINPLLLLATGASDIFAGSDYLGKHWLPKHEKQKQQQIDAEDLSVKNLLKLAEIESGLSGLGLKGQLGAAQLKSAAEQLNASISAGKYAKAPKVAGKAAISPGQRAADIDTGKEVAKYDYLGGYASAQKSLNQLKAVRDALASTTNLTGPYQQGLTLSIPERKKQWDNLKTQMDESIQLQLRPILGSQFTQDEATRMLQQLGDVGQPETVLVQRLDRSISALSKKIDAMEATANHFKSSGGSMQGFTVPRNAGDDKDSTKSRYKVGEKITRNGRTFEFLGGDDKNPKNFKEIK
jgi:hypothetical protein